MGNWFCRNKKFRILILGLDSVGKTTLLYHMKLGEVVKTIPTIGFNVETVQLDGGILTIWDLGSRNKLRPLWHHYFADAQGFVFMIDSADRMRLNEALEELSNLLYSQETMQKVIMILANKQDIEGAMSAQEIEDAFLARCPISKHCLQILFVVPCSTLDKSQVMEAFSYFVHHISLSMTRTAKYGLITVKEQQLQMMKNSKAESEQSLKFILQNPVHYLKTNF